MNWNPKEDSIHPLHYEGSEGSQLYIEDTYGEGQTEIQDWYEDRYVVQAEKWYQPSPKEVRSGQDRAELEQFVQEIINMDT